MNFSMVRSCDYEKTLGTILQFILSVVKEVSTSVRFVVLTYIVNPVSNLIFFFKLNHRLFLLNSVLPLDCDWFGIDWI